MNAIKYVALDVHIASITVVVMSSAGRILGERIIQTSALKFGNFSKERVAS